MRPRGGRPSALPYVDNGIGCDSHMELRVFSADTNSVSEVLCASLFEKTGRNITTIVVYLVVPVGPHSPRCIFFPRQVGINICFSPLSTSFLLPGRGGHNVLLIMTYSLDRHISHHSSLLFLLGTLWKGPNDTERTFCLLNRPVVSKSSTPYY